MTMVISGSGTIAGLVAGGLPDTTVTQPDLAAGVAGTGPAFSAYNSAGLTLTAATNTKMVFNVKTFDTNTNFDNTTNYRFTPTVAGYYQISAAVNFQTSGSPALVQLWKNGATYAEFGRINGAGTIGGSTTVYVYNQSGGIAGSNSGAPYAWFSGALVRAA